MNYKLFPAESNLMLCKNLLFIGIFTQKYRLRNIQFYV